MILAIGLKRINDICFYLTFASIFVSWMGGANLIKTLPVFVLATFLSAFLNSQGKIKYITLLVILISFVMVPFKLINIVALIPIMIYMFYELKNTYKSDSQINYNEIFKLFVKVFFITISFMIIWSTFQSDLMPLIQNSLSFGIFFLVGSITLMRMLRHDETVLNQPEFQLFNALPLLGLILISLLTSSSFFLNLIGKMVNFLFFRIISPILSTIFLYIIFPFLNFIFSFLGSPIDSNEMSLNSINNVIEFGALTDMEVEGLDIFNLLLMVIFAVLIIFVIIKLFQKLLLNSEPYNKAQGIQEIRKSLSDEKKSPSKSKHRRNNQIRDIYRKYLLLCQDNGIQIEPFMTSLDVEQQASKYFQNSESKELREMYIKVRYNHCEYSKAEVKQARTLYKKISKKINEKN